MRYRLLSTLALALALAAPLARAQERPPPSVLEQLERALGDAIDRARPSVVQVQIRRTLAGEEGVRRDHVATSGVVWSAGGDIVSLGRAFEAADSVEVLIGAEARPATVVGTDDDTGLALLKIDPAGLKTPLRPAALGVSKTLRPGAFCVAVTNPFGLAGSASVGNIAATDRTVRRGRMALAGVLQITNPVNPGDPGGLLANGRGELVGIVASTYERSLVDSDALGKIYRDVVRFGEGLFGKPAPEDLRRLVRGDEARFQGGPMGTQGIGFAIPVDQAREVVERLKAHPTASRPWLGVQVVDSANVAPGAPSREYVVVVGVKEGSPAEKAGLKQGDEVSALDGQEITHMYDLRRIIQRAKVGREIELRIRRGEAVSTVRIVLEARGEKP